MYPKSVVTKMLGEPGRSAEVTHMQGWGHSPRVASLSPHSGQDPGGPGPLPAPASGRGALRGPPAHPFPSRLYSSSSCPGHKESRAPPAEAVRTQSWPVGAAHFSLVSKQRQRSARTWTPPRLEFSTRSLWSGAGSLASLPLVHLISSWTRRPPPTSSHGGAVHGSRSRPGPSAVGTAETQGPLRNRGTCA